LAQAILAQAASIETASLASVICTPCAMTAGPLPASVLKAPSDKDVENAMPAAIDSDSESSGTNDSVVATSTSTAVPAPACTPSPTKLGEQVVKPGWKHHQYWEFNDAYESKENKFILIALGLCLSLVLLCLVMSASAPSSFGTFYMEMVPNFFIIFGVEFVWRFMLSCVAWYFIPKYKRTVNYTRKLGNLMKLYKFFLADDVLPAMRKEPLTLIFFFAVDQLVYIVMFAHAVRKRSNPLSRFLRFCFIQQDRPEDRPDTLVYQTTEDIMRFAVLLPFKLFFLRLYLGGHEATIYIPVTVNSIGDGLAEPVGVFFSTWFRKHLGWDVTYRTKSLWTSEGGFWSGSFRRSYPGSFCVFATTVVALSLEHDEFSSAQLVYLYSMLPYWMTMTEAFAPHTNDGPFMNLMGCGLLAVTYLLIE